MQSCLTEPVADGERLGALVAALATCVDLEAMLYSLETPVENFV